MHDIKELLSPVPFCGIFAHENASSIDVIVHNDPCSTGAGSYCTQCLPMTLHGEIEFRNYWQKSCARIRIVVLRQPYSWAPLGVSIQAFECFVAQTNALGDIWTIARSFRTKTSNEETGFAPCAWREEEITYLFKFPEKKLDEEGEATWVVRQMGIYQQYDVMTGKHIWAMIFPNREMDRTQDIIQNYGDHPLQPHVSLILSCIHNWRWYLSDFDQRHQKAAARVLNVEIERDLGFVGIYKQLSELRFVEKNIACLRPILTGMSLLLSRLKQWNTSLGCMGQINAELAHNLEISIGSLEATVEGLQANVNFLLSSISNAVEMASDTISLKSQNTTEIMSDRMLRDSAAIRVITMVTLVYLPATFTSGFFGMGFFATDPDSGGRWIVAPHIWIYFILAIPMTVITLGYWRWRTYQTKSTDRNGSFV